MPTWVSPAIRWTPLSPADDVLNRLETTGRHLITWPPAPFESTSTYCYLIDGHYWIWQPDVGGVVFTADLPELLLHPLADTDRAQFEHLVRRSWLPAIYPIWRRQVLHASAVANPSGEVIAFTGPGGAGKSTTAFALAQRAGWRMVADDTLAFSCDAADHIELHPLRSEARLRAATAAHFGNDDAHEVPFTWPDGPLRLAAIYALDASDDGTAPIVFTPLSASDVFTTILGQAHALSLNVPEHNQRLMRDYLTLASAAPAFRLQFPRAFDRLADTLDAVEAHASAHGVNLQHAPQANPETPGSHDASRC